MMYLPIFGLVVALLLLFVWALRRPQNGKPSGDVLPTAEDSAAQHIAYLRPIQQTLSPADLEYLTSKGSAKLSRRVRKERRKVALSYVAALQNDFGRLLRLARVIAVLSPKVGAVQEFERLRLSVHFRWRYQLVRVLLQLELAPMPQLSSLSDMVSAFAVRMQEAMNELGERAALAAEMASSLERRGIDLG
jgi:hypothetical protein